MRVGVLRELAAGERRVALSPEAVGRLRSADVEVLVENDAGAAAWFGDEEYAQAGATVTTREHVLADAEAILSIGRVPAEQLHDGQALIGLLAPLLDPSYATDLAEHGVTAISLDGLPRTLTRAQSMDALSSQANVAGYKAVLVATAHYDRFLPMLITAAGTSRPAQVLVLGAGVAGLQTIGTARRLGAVVRAYDVRPAAKGEVGSLGATFLELTATVSAAGEGGYARSLTAEEQAGQQAELAEHISKHDIVITTAQVPGRRPPLMVTADAIKAMKPGSVVVDLAASELGGNVEISKPDETIVTSNGVTIIGAPNLPSEMATSASTAYARNISALLLHLLHDGSLVIDLDDEIQRGVVITHDGKVVHPGTSGLLESQ